MALRIEELRQRRAGPAYRSPVRLAVTADGELVEDTDPRAAFLLVGAGGEIPWDLAARYGLVVDDEPAPEGRRVRRASDKRVKDVEDKAGG